MSKRIVIVGGGIAGLTAGIFARLYGFESVIAEKHSLLGGQCTGWYRNGEFVDGCMHWLTGTDDGRGLNKLWRDIGMLGGVEVVEPAMFFRFEAAGGA
ncbi:MAG: NAD(P)/FAD-dependent oxidoreductase, partial [Clostridiales bacterium]|nr:NAD(P)/FAD-dependent oxidoreductase [Clostridiales bacterium]